MITLKRILLACLMAPTLTLAQTATSETPKETPETQSPWDEAKDAGRKAVDATAKAVTEAQRAISEGAELRGKRRFGALVNWAYIDLWIPSKLGITGFYNRNSSHTYELEYMRGSLGYSAFGVDIGEITDQRLSGLWRWFGGRNSFNLASGVYYNNIRARLGDDLLATVSGNQAASIEIVELETLGVTFGLGNRWMLKNGFIFAADWLMLNIPLWVIDTDTPFLDRTTSNSSREEVDDALRLFKYIPTIVALKIQIGVSF